MEVLTTAFFDVMRDVRCVEHRLCTLTAVVQTLRRFDRVLDGVSPIVLEEFRDTYHSEIARVKYTLKAFRDPQTTSLHDKIFTNRLAIPKAVPLGITRLFEEFIKGISYFKHERLPEAMPVYHRLFSCGPGDTAFRSTFLVCDQTLSKSEKKVRQGRIRKCYLERLIYDSMYRHETPNAQDSQHLFRLDLTKTDFQSCFQGRDMRIDIQWDSGMPTVLTVEHVGRDGNVDYTERFVKTFTFMQHGNKVLDPSVDCTKTTSTKKYFKIQTFDRESAYRLVP